MDNNQVVAVRHKRHIIALNVLLDENTISELTDRKLINKGMLDNMKVARKYAPLFKFTCTCKQQKRRLY